jgi:hypothetical protein
MKKLFSFMRLAVMAATLLVSSLIAASGENDDEIRAFMSRGVELELKFAALANELKQAGPLPPWAGDFRHGDGLGMNRRLVISPSGSFAATLHGCMGLYASAMGAAHADEPGVRLELSEKREPNEFGKFADSYIPVTWGERHYLIASSQMIEFVNQVNSGLEEVRGRSAFFFLRTEDEEKPSIGSPDLPMPYRSLLRSQTIRGELTSLANGSKPDRAVLNVGRKHGVFEGMEFHSRDPHVFGHAKVIRVDETQSEVVIDVYGRQDKPFVGLSFSSRFDDGDRSGCAVACGYQVSNKKA